MAVHPCRSAGSADGISVSGRDVGSASVDPNGRDCVSHQLNSRDGRHLMGILAVSGLLSSPRAIAAQFGHGIGAMDRLLIFLCGAAAGSVAHRTVSPAKKERAKP